MLDLKTVRSDWPPEPLTWEDPVPLTLTDLTMNMERDKGFAGQASAVKRITERHHALARLLASGTAPGHAAIITGYDASRISILQTDPSFAELVDFYTQDVEAEYRSMHAQMAGLGGDAIDELRRRVEDEPEKLGAQFLLDVVTKIADRTGNGPTTSVTQEVNITLDLSARMKMARERARQAIEGTMVDVTPAAAAE